MSVWSCKTIRVAGWRTGAALLSGSALAMALPAGADGARDWLNVPVGMNFLYVYYTYSEAYSSIDSVLPVEGASVESHVPILRYARSMDIGGRTGGIQLIAPYGFVDARLDGTGVKTSRDGLGDIQGIFIVNLSGAPALTREQFAGWTPGSYLTASLGVTAPTGAYDRDRLVNVGKNRWALKPQISYGVPFNQAYLFAVNGNVQFFTRNDEYLRDGTLRQDPLFTVDAHLSKSLSRAFWVSADAVYLHGGETEVDGAGRDNQQRTWRLGVSGSLNLSPVDAVTLSYTDTVSKREATPGGYTFSMSYSHAW